MTEDVTVWNMMPPIPQGTKPLTHQVGGHIFGRANGFKSNFLGFLQNDEGNILKPVQGPKKGQREVEFYKKMFEDDFEDSELITLKSLVPKFEGMWSTMEHPNVVYLRLEDLTTKFQIPCVMDVKIGPVTYDMFADNEKIKREKSKFRCLDKVGFQLVGLKVYDPKTKEYVVRDRTYLRALNEKSISTHGLVPFFNCGEKGSKHLINSFLRRLKDIENWFLSQKKFVFIASSLLFIYDGRAFMDESNHNFNSNDLENRELNHVDVSCKSPILSSLSSSSSSFPCMTGKKHEFQTKEFYFDNITDLRMIDFTHTFPSSSESFDENYLIGLRSLIEYLQQLLEL